MKKINKNKYKLYLIAILCTILWGSAIPSIKLGYDFFNIEAKATADKLLFAGIRFLGAGLIILIPYFISRKEIAFTKKLCANSLVLGIIQTAGQYFFMYIGLAYTTGGNLTASEAQFHLIVDNIYRDML